MKKDKIKHVLVEMAIVLLSVQALLLIGTPMVLAFIIGSVFALGVGFARELFGSTPFSWKDIVADLVGVFIGIGLNLLTL